MHMLFHIDGYLFVKIVGGYSFLHTDGYFHSNIFCMDRMDRMQTMACMYQSMMQDPILFVRDTATAINRGKERRLLTIIK